MYNYNNTPPSSHFPTGLNLQSSRNIVTSLKKTSAGVRLEGTLALFLLSVAAIAAFTSSGCLLWWFFSAMAADSFSACSHSNSRVAMGDERTVVEESRSRSPV